MSRAPCAGCEAGSASVLSRSSMTGISGMVWILAVVPAETADFSTKDSAGAPRRPQVRRRRFLKNDGCKDVVGANLSYLEQLVPRPGSYPGQAMPVTSRAGVRASRGRCRAAARHSFAAASSSGSAASSTSRSPPTARRWASASRRSGARCRSTPSPRSSRCRASPTCGSTGCTCVSRRSTPTRCASSSRAPGRCACRSTSPRSTPLRAGGRKFAAERKDTT